MRCDATGSDLEGRCGDTSDNVASEGSTIAHPDVGVLERGLVRAHGTRRRVPASVTWLGEGARACVNPIMMVSKSKWSRSLLVAGSAQPLAYAQQQARLVLTSEGSTSSG